MYSTETSCSQQGVFGLYSICISSIGYTLHLHFIIHILYSQSCVTRLAILAFTKSQIQIGPNLFPLKDEGGDWITISPSRIVYDRSFASFTGTNFYGVCHIINKDFSITDMPGATGFFSSL